MNDGVVAVQVINYLLNNNTFEPIINRQMDDSYFPGYENEFNYIKKHWDTTKLLDGKSSVPDKIKFSFDFPDFPLFETGDTINTMLQQLHEQKCYSLFVEKLQKGAELTKDSSFEAIQFLKEEMNKLFKFAYRTIGSGHDLIKRANERLEDYIKRIQMQGLMGITTGLDDLDKELFGWLPEELALVIARTNEGKSWLLLFFALMAWLSGKKVAIYSGEMGPLMYGFRFDTMYKHFRNSSLISGDINLGTAEIPEVGVKSLNEYRSYIEALIAGEFPSFTVYTPKDFDGEPMNVEQMKILQEKEGYEFWGLDQLSLMSDIKKGRDVRARYSNISAGLFSFTEEYQVPIILLHQANRKAAESKKKDGNATPELEDSQDADAIAQNSTRVLSFTQIENGAKISVRKNRYGKRGQEILTTWNIDYGIFKSLNAQSIKDNLF